MGKRGPARTPSAVLKLRGTYREDRHGNAEAPSEIPDCPEWLCDAAKLEWSRVCPLLVKTVGLARLDMGMLAGYCESLAEYARLVQEVRETGETYEQITEAGVSIRKHPLVVVRNEARAALLKFAAQFGMSPSARNGLKIELPKEGESAEERFLA